MTAANDIRAEHTPATQLTGTNTPERPSIAARLEGLAGRTYLAIRGEAVLVAVLVSSFILRWLIADRNSYWLDEVLSVHVYGHWHESSLAALRHLASNSVHPPLYQFILYHWVDWFGEAERATRSLSHLYIVLATLFLYLLLKGTFSRRIALLSTVGFVAMYTPIYYALETRSYAQTIFLATLSSYLLLRILRLAGMSGWRSALVSPTAGIFTLTNAGLLLTHYYNVFFWIAQGLIAVVFVLLERPSRQWLAGLSIVGCLYIVQGTIFWLIWGNVLLADISRRGSAFSAEGSIRGPLDLLRTVVEPNIAAPRLIILAGLAVCMFMLGGAVAALVQGTGLTQVRQRAWTKVYLAGWLIVPLLVAYGAFAISGIARYSSRYWLYIVPPLAPLVVLSLQYLLELVKRAAGRSMRPTTEGALVTIAALTATAAFILPGTLAAATETKHDWRGMVQQIVRAVEADSDSEYVIFETSHRRRPMTDYYFERFSQDIRVYDTIQRYEEREGEYRVLALHEDAIARYDYLVIIFNHSRTAHFPNVLLELEKRYEPHYRQLDSDGRGFIVFAVQP